jgi:hypothetical protein
VVGGAADSVRFLYIGEPDEAGEYPVLSVRKEPAPWVGGFVPFDVWLAQELGALPAGEPLAPAYDEAIKALAESNGDGRVGFTPEAGEASDEDEDEEDDDEEDSEDQEDAASDEDDEEAGDDEGDDEDEEDEGEP